MIEDALSFWTEIQRYEDMLAADASSLCFAPLSELYRRLGLLNDAISVAQKGCALHPDYSIGFLALGNACYDQGMTVEARKALERAVTLKPDHLQALRMLGQLYVEQGELVLARKVLGQVQQQDPDDMESALLLSSLGASSASAPTAQPEEEIVEELEELEVIEELDEILDEPLEEVSAPAVPARGAPVASAGIGLAEEAALRAPSARAEDDDELWAIEDLEEPAAAQPRRAQAQAEGRVVPDPLTTATLAELYVSQGFIDKALTIYGELLQAHPYNQQYQLRKAELLELQSLQHLQPEVQKQPDDQASQPGLPPAQPEPQVTQQVQEAQRPVPESSQPVQQVRQPPLGAPPEEIPPPEPVARQRTQQETTRDTARDTARETPVVQAAPAAPQGDVTTELSRWLDNIRRRRDGV